MCVLPEVSPGTVAGQSVDSCHSTSAPPVQVLLLGEAQGLGERPGWAQATHRPPVGPSHWWKQPRLLSALLLTRLSLRQLLSLIIDASCVGVSSTW